MIKLLITLFLVLGFAPGHASAVTYEYEKGVFTYAGKTTFCAAVGPNGCSSVAQACAEHGKSVSYPQGTGSGSRTVTCNSSNEVSPWKYTLSCTATGTGSCGSTYNGVYTYSGVVSSNCVAPWTRNTDVATGDWDSNLYCKKEVTEPPPPPPCVAQEAGNMDVTIYYTTGPDIGSAIVGPTNSPADAQQKEYCPQSRCIVKPSGPPNSCKQDQVPTLKGYYRTSCNFPMVTTGVQCPDLGAPPPPVAPEPSEDPPEDKGKCPAGSVASGQDSFGMTICVGTSKPPAPPTTTTEKPEVTTPNPDGGSTTTKQTTTTNSDGSTTTTTTTTVTAPDGTKTTTVDSSTSPRPTGEAGTADKPEDKSDLCKQNPQLNVCKNSQVIGTCGQVTCSGDAIQCATLRAAAAMECKQREDADILGKSSLHALGAAAAAGTDPMTLPGPKNSVAIAMPASLDGSGWLGGGAPFSDKTFTVQGHTITIPFAQAVGYLIVLRYALMIVALLVSFRILSGAIIRE